MFFKGIISADSHIVEPPNCYVDFIDPKFREDAPRVVRKENGQDIYVIKDLKQTVPLGFLDGAGMTVLERQKHVATTKFEETRAGGYDAKARLADMDREGTAAEIIYASVGMVLCTHPDPIYKNAAMQAYNRWLQSFCEGAPNRLFGLAQTAVLSVDSAIEDFRRAKEMGMVGMMMPGEPAQGDYDQPEYDALWECATSLDMPICFHILTSRAGDLNSVFATSRGHPLVGFMKIIRAVQDIIALMVMGGVFERHPKLKLVCAEGDAGWMPHYMYRMDHAAKFNVDKGIIPGLSQLPSAYLAKNVFMTFQDDYVAFQNVMAGITDHRQLLWANDYPHTDSTWPHSQSLLAEQAKNVPQDKLRAILRENTARLFNLPLDKMPSMQMAAE
jgi:uncharacterized protein